MAKRAWKEKALWNWLLAYYPRGNQQPVSVSGRETDEAWEGEGSGLLCKNKNEKKIFKN